MSSYRSFNHQSKSSTSSSASTEDGDTGGLTYQQMLYKNSYRNKLPTSSTKKGYPGRGNYVGMPRRVVYSDLHELDDSDDSDTGSQASLHSLEDAEKTGNTNSLSIYSFDRRFPFMKSAVSAPVNETADLKAASRSVAVKPEDMSSSKDAPANHLHRPLQPSFTGSNSAFVAVKKITPMPHCDVSAPGASRDVFGTAHLESHDFNQQQREEMYQSVDKSSDINSKLASPSRGGQVKTPPATPTKNHKFVNSVHKVMPAGESHVSSALKAAGEFSERKAGKVNRQPLSELSNGRDAALSRDKYAMPSDGKPHAVRKTVSYSVVPSGSASSHTRTPAEKSSGDLGLFTCRGVDAVGPLSRQKSMPSLGRVSSTSLTPAIAAGNRDKENVRVERRSERGNEATPIATTWAEPVRELSEASRDLSAKHTDSRARMDLLFEGGGEIAASAMRSHGNRGIYPPALRAGHTSSIRSRTAVSHHNLLPGMSAKTALIRPEPVSQQDNHTGGQKSTPQLLAQGSTGSMSNVSVSATTFSGQDVSSSLQLSSQPFQVIHNGVKMTVVPATACPTPTTEQTATSATQHAAASSLIRDLGKDIITINGKSYIVFTLLGKGGSSKVYQVLDSEKKRYLAVKCVDLDGADDVTIKSYENEITLLRRLEYSGKVIKLHDYEYNKQQKCLYLLMESGDTDLAVWLRSRNKTGQNTHEMRMYYWAEMLKCVAIIHKEGIVHSDLKPANFLIVRGELKLIDFGIANAIQKDKTSITKDYQMGTLNYMSPEAIQDTSDPFQYEAGGNKKHIYKVGVKADVWSLGCILYNMAYGKTPFQHITNQIAKLQAIINPAYDIKYPDCGEPELVDTLKKCLDRDPKKRASIADLLNHPYLNKKRAADVSTLTEDKLKKILLQIQQADVNSPTTLSAITRGVIQNLQSGKEVDISSILSKRQAAQSGSSSPV
ncbi:PREDICTED: probable serine/threonine-protein kinase mkcC [Priapulus caudatus]|uniref:Probable serine/threonine-protein kinase mkcC n=1 Tax=Priapulus caudatus TaxID=37621 RepID=A0ABM1E5M3_PRICU|nr:PREDICTED: probable serine/threonine-protein kinase mkcC [Priapulus caudatus]